MIKRWNKYAEQHDDKKKLTLQQIKRASNRLVDTELLQRFEDALEKTHQLVSKTTGGMQSLDFELFKDILNTLKPVYLSEEQIAKFLEKAKEFLERRIANKDVDYYNNLDAKKLLKDIENKIQEYKNTKMKSKVKRAPKRIKLNLSDSDEDIERALETISQIQEKLQDLPEKYKKLKEEKKALKDNETD